MLYPVSIGKIAIKYNHKSDSPVKGAEIHLLKYNDRYRELTDRRKKYAPPAAIHKKKKDIRCLSISLFINQPGNKKLKEKYHPVLCCGNGHWVLGTGYWMLDTGYLKREAT